MTTQLEQKATDLQRLETLEKIIDTVRNPFDKGLAALGEILRDKLWKAAGYKSESDYLSERWGKMSWGQEYYKKRIAKIAATIGAENMPDGVRESHLACLSAFNDEPEFQKQILKEAAKSAPDGKLTADHIEKTAHRLMDERRALLKAQKEEESQRAAAAARVTTNEEEEEEEEDSGEEESPAATPAPARASSAIGRASSHPIADEARIWKKTGQAVRTIRKLDRIATELNMTREDLLEKFDSGELEDMLKRRVA